MLRRTIVGCTVASVALIAPAVASADTTHSVTIVSTLSYPSGWEMSSTPTFCTSMGTVDPTGTHQTGPATPPLGKGSLVIAVPPGEVADLIYTFPADADRDLSRTTLSSYAYPVADGDTPMTATAHLYLSYGPANDSDYYDLSAPLPSAHAWQGSDPYAASSWNSGSGAFGSPPETPVGTSSGSYAQFLSASSAATLGELDVDFNNCNGTTTQKYALDDITTGLTTGTTPDATTTNTTVNFEASPPTVLTPHLSATAITSGGTVTPSVTVSVKSEKDLSGFVVTLSKKTAGTSTYRTVVTRTTNTAGLATAPTQKLTHTTTYRWTYVPLPYSIFEPGTSKPVTVSVASKVTMHPAKTVIGKHGSLHVSGQVRPGHKGATVTLHATKSGHPVTATGHEHADGSYTITKHLPAGRYRVYVHVSKDSTNAAGTSRHVTVVVR